MYDVKTLINFAWIHFRSRLVFAGSYNSVSTNKSGHNIDTFTAYNLGFQLGTGGLREGLLWLNLLVSRGWCRLHWWLFCEFIGWFGLSGTLGLVGQPLLVWYAQCPQSWKPFGGTKLVFKPVCWDYSESEISHYLLLVSFGYSRFKPPTIWDQLFTTIVSESFVQFG